MKFRLETMVNTYNVRSKASRKRVQILDVLFSQTTTTNISQMNRRIV